MNDADTFRDVLPGEGAEVGAYRVVRLLGKGGMGAVYEVEHVRLGVRYAMKVFAFGGKNAEFLTKRFFAEGRLLARLSHPRIVRVYDMDVTDRFAWFTMDYVEGPDGQPKTLASVPQAGILPEETVAGWYEDVRTALAAVHAVGVVHRDVKLENILVGKDGRAVLSDFGISRIVDERLRSEIAVTRTMVASDASMKVVLGTAAYLAPEVRAGGQPTAASDLYALGIAFFRLLTGLWYEPGPHAFDLLAPFDRRWKPVFASLLASDPSARRAEGLRPAPRRRLRKGLLAAGFAAVLAAGLAAAGAYCLWQGGEGERRLCDEDVDETFAIPESVD